MQSISSEALPREAWVPPKTQTPLYPAARRQWLAVDGFVTDRFLVSYRAPCARLRALVPAPFTLDDYEGYGFLSVCVLEVRAMGIRALPRALRFANLEVLYRLGVRFRGQPTFVTLRSDTSSRALAWLGGCFSHYRLRRAHIQLSHSEGRFRLEAHTPDASGDAWLDVVLGAETEQAQACTSVFASAEAADRQLLGMAFSVDPGRGANVLCQAIEHSPWQARFVEPSVARFEFLERLSRDYAVPLTYDNTLLMQNIRQTWLAARWVHKDGSGFLPHRAEVTP